MLRIIILALLLVGGPSFLNSPAQAQPVSPFRPGAPTRLCTPSFVPSCPPRRVPLCIEPTPCAYFNQTASMCARWACIPQYYIPRRGLRR
jgi:hypothetical protein